MTSPVLILLNLLRASPAVAAHLGDRIHVEDAPAGTAGAYAVVRASGGERTNALSRSTGHKVARMTVIVFAETFAAADGAATAIEKALRDLRTKVGNASVKIMPGSMPVSDTVGQPKRYRLAAQFDMHISE